MTITRPEPERRMSHTEAVALCRYAKAACPQQAFDEYTPDAWADLLSDLRYEDALQALKECVKRKPFVAPAEVRDEVKRLRDWRIASFGPIPDPPQEIGDDEWQRWYFETRRAIGDGTLTRDNAPPELESGKARDVDALLAQIPVRKP